MRWSRRHFTLAAALVAVLALSWGLVVWIRGPSLERLSAGGQAEGTGGASAKSSQMATSDRSVPASEEPASKRAGTQPAPGVTPRPPKAKKASPRWVVWLQDLAPTSGGADMPNAIAYYQIVDDECSSALETAKDLEGDASTSVYRGAARACLAAFHDRPELWDDAAQDLRAAAHDDRVLCTERVLYDLLQTLVQTHTDHPAAKLLKSNKPSGVLPCPRIFSVSPSHGPAAGGYEVVAHGESLPAKVTILIDDLASDEYDEVIGTSNAAGTETVFVMPSAPTNPLRTDGEENEDGGVLLQTVDWPEWGWAEFSYDPPVTATDGDQTQPSADERSGRP